MQTMKRPVLKVGDTVTLRSGGPKMVVIGFDDPDLDFPLSEDVQVICEWFQGNELKTVSFTADALMEAESARSEDGLPG